VGGGGGGGVLRFLTVRAQDTLDIIIRDAIYKEYIIKSRTEVQRQSAERIVD